VRVRGPLADDASLVWVETPDGRLGVVEASLLRPLLRGEDLRPWRAEPAGDRILWTHGPDGRPLHALPPNADAWLAPWRDALRDRVDARRARAWWSLFRTEAARADAPRVVWADIGRAPRAVVLEAGDATVPLNTCYALRCASAHASEDAHALAAVLNAPLARAWLSAVAEPARGGYRRFLGWTMALLPLPRDWPAARRRLAPLARRAATGHALDDTLLMREMLAAYDLAPGTVAPLLGWTP
jgi:hypothetical protein